MNICIICGDAVGGLRKHVHDIILYPKGKLRNFLYVHSEIIDDTGRNDFFLLKQNNINRVELRITKQPGFRDLINICKLIFLCKRFKVDLVHGHGAKGGLYARVVGVFIRKPVVYTPHGGSVHRRFGLVKGFFYDSIEYLLKWFTTKFIFESEYTCQAFMLNMGYISPSKFIVNYNGVDKRRFNSIRKWSDNLSKELRLLSIGSLSSAKGQDVAIRALQVIKENNINCYLDICGSGENLEKLKVLAQGIGVDDRVIFHGDVSNVIKYYEESAIVIIPSIFESFGYVAVESALMNRPVVASNTGGLSEIIIDGETGILVTPGDHHDLANSVIKMISNIEGTNCMVSAARARAIDLFDTERMLNVLYEIYDSTTPDSV